MSDKRAQFFVLAAVVCLALVPVAHDDFKRVTLAVSATYLLLALASYLDHRSKQ